MVNSPAFPEFKPLFVGTLSGLTVEQSQEAHALEALAVAAEAASRIYQDVLLEVGVDEWGRANVLAPRCIVAKKAAAVKRAAHHAAIGRMRAHRRVEESRHRHLSANLAACDHRRELMDLLIRRYRADWNTAP